MSLFIVYATCDDIVNAKFLVRAESAKLAVSKVQEIDDYEDAIHESLFKLGSELIAEPVEWETDVIVL